MCYHSGIVCCEKKQYLPWLINFVEPAGRKSVSLLFLESPAREKYGVGVVTVMKGDIGLGQVMGCGVIPIDVHRFTRDCMNRDKFF